MVERRLGGFGCRETELQLLEPPDELLLVWHSAVVIVPGLQLEFHHVAGVDFGSSEVSHFDSIMRAVVVANDYVGCQIGR